MQSAFSPYPAYRDSGVPWIGEVPSHWETKRNKYIFRLKKSLVGKKSSEYDLLSLTLNGVIRRDMENPEGKFPAEFDTYQEVEKGDFVFCLFDVEETPRTVGLSPYSGMITGAYTVFDVVGGLDKKFLYYFYLNLDSRKALKFIYRGLRNTIPKESFFSFKTLLPPLPEQNAIARFLDKQTVQLDRAIGQKQRLIALLQERRQVLIQQAVTRGLDLSVPMRESGVDWMGEVPAHWEVKANRSLFQERNQPGKDGLPLLSVSIHSAVSSEEMDEEENIRAKIKIKDKSNYKLVEEHDIVFNMMRAWQGAIGAVKVQGMVSPAYIVAKPKPGLDSAFFEYQYRSPDFILQMDRNSKGITDFRKRLYWDEFKQLVTIIPPLAEQQAIVSHIESQSTQIDRAIALQERHIEQLREYRSVLIHEVVTGKVKIS